MQAAILCQNNISLEVKNEAWPTSQLAGHYRVDEKSLVSVPTNNSAMFGDKSYIGPCPKHALDPGLPNVGIWQSSARQEKEGGCITSEPRMEPVD